MPVSGYFSFEVKNKVLAMEIKKQDILRIERLARLKLPEQAEQDFSQRLTKVFDWIDQLREVPIDGVDPMTSPLMTLDAPKTKWRQDVVNDGDLQDQVLKNAPDAQHGYFSVPKVVE
jgi:aspartyl-tRNA(Asn)/glutamyl-tRNA(Gln) amidotransferase subunit C